MRRSRSSYPRRAGAGLGLAAAVAMSGACGAAPAEHAAPAVPACPVDRVVVLASRADVARLAGCTTARGVTIRTGGALDVSSLHALAAITGDLVIGPTVGVQEITLGELRRVDGALHVVSNGLLQGLFLPRLEHAGRIEIEGNGAITTISLPRLAAVAGAVRIRDNASLELIDVPALVAIDAGLVLTADPKLTVLEAGQLQRASRVELDAPGLPLDVADRLRALGEAP